jgi:osmoprotectant transport system permease protein
MLSFTDFWNWISAEETWQARYGLWNLLAEHLTLTFVALFAAGLFAIPVGLAIGHFRKGEFFVIAISSISRAVPTMGLLFALVILLGVEFRSTAVYAALGAIAIPALLAGTYSGLIAIPQTTVDGARAQGLTELQIIWHVEIPLSLASMLGGLRIAFVQVVSTVTLAPLVGLGGLGFGIVQGLALRDFSQITGSALAVVLLTVIGDRILSLAQKANNFSRLKTKKGRR